MAPDPRSPRDVSLWMQSYTRKYSAPARRLRSRVDMRPQCASAPVRSTRADMRARLAYDRTSRQDDLVAVTKPSTMAHQYHTRPRRMLPGPFRYSLLMLDSLIVRRC